MLSVSDRAVRQASRCERSPVCVAASASKMNFKEEQAALLEEQRLAAIKGPKQTLTTRDDTSTKKRAKNLEPAALEARKHMKRKAAEFDEGDPDGDRQVRTRTLVYRVPSLTVDQRSSPPCGSWTRTSL